MKRAILAAAAVVTLQGCAQMGVASSSGGWTTLFDGSGLSSFVPVGDANWRVEGNTVVADKGTGFLVTREEYADFEIKAEFYAEADTNSGIFIRCTDKVNLTSVVCYEVNIWDMRPVQKYGTGAIVDVAAVDPMPRAGGKWNTYVITAKGDHMVVMLNGVKTADVHHSRNKNGVIGLQYAPGTKKDSGLPIKFRNVQIRRL